MRKLTILVDMDDVLNNLLEVWLNQLNCAYDLMVRYQDIRKWDMRLYFPTLTEKQIYKPLESSYFWLRVGPKPGARKALVDLIEQGHVVKVVTASRPRSVYPKLNNCLFYHYPFLTYKDVIVASDKTMIRGDVLVDDRQDNLIGGEYQGILFAAPHNEDFEAEKHGLIRANEWKDVVTIINKLATDNLGDR